MTPLDLRIQPPRHPRERLDGLVFMPRTIDKVRATLPGGDLGPYQIAHGLSRMLLSIIRIEFEALRYAVVAAASDEDVALWLRANADVSQYELANAVLAAWRHENVPAEHRELFESKYPEYLLRRYPVAFDLIEADDRESYPAFKKR
jgi:hypothetical protein